MKRILVVLLLTLLVIGCSKKEMPVIQHANSEMEYYVKRYVKQVSTEYYYLAYYHQGMDSPAYYAEKYIDNSYMTKVLDTIYNSIKTNSIWHYSKKESSYIGTWVYTIPEYYSMTTEVEFQDTMYNYFRIRDSVFVSRIDNIIVKELIKRYCPL